MNQQQIINTRIIQKYFNPQDMQSTVSTAMHVQLNNESATYKVVPEQLLSFLLDCKNSPYHSISIKWQSSLLQRILFVLFRSVRSTALSYYQVTRFLRLAGFKTETSWVKNCVEFFTSTHTLIGRRQKDTNKEYTVSVVIPCKNEAGNIERAIQELPEFGSDLEIIFVEGASQDNTWAEIERVQKLYPHKKIKRIKQNGRGKAAAVHNGFEAATGNVLIILDGDLSVPPSEITHCYEIIRSNPNALINGTRMWLTMEKNATPFLNYFCNKGFAYLLSILTRTRLSDTLCGTKVLSRENYLRMTQLPTYLESVDPFGDFTLILGAHDLQLPIIEVPFNYKARTYGSTQIHRFKNGFDLLTVLGFYSLKRIQKFWRKAHVCNLNERK